MSSSRRLSNNPGSGFDQLRSVAAQAVPAAVTAAVIQCAPEKQRKLVEKILEALQAFDTSSENYSREVS